MLPNNLSSVRVMSLADTSLRRFSTNPIADGFSKPMSDAVCAHGDQWSVLSPWFWLGWLRVIVEYMGAAIQLNVHPPDLPSPPDQTVNKSASERAG